MGQSLITISMLSASGPHRPDTNIHLAPHYFAVGDIIAVSQPGIKSVKVAYTLALCHCTLLLYSSES